MWPVSRLMVCANAIRPGPTAPALMTSTSAANAVAGRRDAISRVIKRFMDARLLFLHDHAPLRVEKNVIAVAILARRDVIVLAARRDADDLAAWHPLQRDHREQILACGGIVGGERGRGEAGCQ